MPTHMCRKRSALRLWMSHARHLWGHFSRQPLPAPYIRWAEITSEQANKLNAHHLRREHGRSREKPGRGGTKHAAPEALELDNHTPAYAPPCGDGGAGPVHTHAPRQRG